MPPETGFFSARELSEKRTGNNKKAEKKYPKKPKGPASSVNGAGLIKSPAPIIVLKQIAAAAKGEIKGVMLVEEFFTKKPLFIHYLHMTLIPKIPNNHNFYEIARQAGKEPCG